MIKYFLDKPLLPTVNLRLERRTEGASGYDLMANLATPRMMLPGERWFVPTGLYLEMPSGVEGQIRTRSGLARDHGVIVLNAPGTIDYDYRGEVCVTLLNTDRSQVHTIHPGDRVAQLVIAPVFTSCANPEFMQYASDSKATQQIVRVASRDELSLTTRGAGGHGSTGI